MRWIALPLVASSLGLGQRRKESNNPVLEDLESGEGLDGLNLLRRLGSAQLRPRSAETIVLDNAAVKARHNSGNQE